MPKWKNYWQALRELGFSQLSWYTWYQLKLKSGIIRKQTQARLLPVDANLNLSKDLFPLPDQASYKRIVDSDCKTHLLQKADDILAGKIQLFGEQTASIDWIHPQPLSHWTAYSHDREQDIKFTWEPGRLGWACTLARAYFASRDEQYAKGYWEQLKSFLEANPPYLGPHWVSAQEAAIRVIVMAFTWQVLHRSVHSTNERADYLAQAIIDHARRIPPTLAYARAQNNNHLLVEAAGLWTAALILPAYPYAKSWKHTGWRWLNWALQNQIEPDGTYIQHSTNYHRLMLQTALWCSLVARSQGQAFPELIQQRLAAASHWLMDMSDPFSGGVPNLGPNDGAHILPLTNMPFRDYRPVIQAAMQAFTGSRPFEEGPWDEMSLWLSQDIGEAKGLTRQSFILSKAEKTGNLSDQPHVLHSSVNKSWAYLRVARFSNRPGHADQLHLDLWWRGINLAQDAGTYQYNAPSPWDNALTHTGVHNTLMVNEKEQMQRIGKFLYLNWAQGKVISSDYALDGSMYRITAQHDGYRDLRIYHRRTVETRAGNWKIEDNVIPVPGKTPPGTFTLRLNWLLPDFPWTMEPASVGVNLQLLSLQGKIQLEISDQRYITQHEKQTAKLSLYRAGECVIGEGLAQPTWGWTSPTYGLKIPALAVIYQIEGKLPLSLITEWIIPSG